MATMRKSLKKLVEGYEPVPGDEQDFVAKHGMKIVDFQGKDSISQESPYELMLKNLAVVKKPGEQGKDDHGHDAPGESEAAYHIPESRDAKIAKLAEMMGMMNPSYENGKDEDEEDDEDEDKPKDKKEIKEAKKQVVGVEMHYTHATKKPFKITHFSVQDAERGRKDYEKMGYKLAGKKAQMGEDIERMVEGSKRMSAAVKLQRAFKDASDQSAASRKRGQEELDNARKEYAKKQAAKTNEEVEQVDENLPLLPKQKEIARNILKKDMEDNKKQKNDNRQAGTPKIMEEDKREENDKVRMARVATARPKSPETVEGMRHRLQNIKKQVNDQT